ncbi:unnamed protein product [Penicillium bialowiezense]
MAFRRFFNGLLFEEEPHKQKDERSIQVSERQLKDRDLELEKDWSEENSEPEEADEFQNDEEEKWSDEDSEHQESVEFQDTESENNPEEPPALGAWGCPGFCIGRCRCRRRNSPDGDNRPAKVVKVPSPQAEPPRARGCPGFCIERCRCRRRNSPDGDNRPAKVVKVPPPPAGPPRDPRISLPPPADPADPADLADPPPPPVNPVGQAGEAEGQVEEGRRGQPQGQRSFLREPRSLSSSSRKRKAGGLQEPQLRKRPRSFQDHVTEVQETLEQGGIGANRPEPLSEQHSGQATVGSELPQADPENWSQTWPENSPVESEVTPEYTAQQPTRGDLERVSILRARGAELQNWIADPDAPGCNVEYRIVDLQWVVDNLEQNGLPTDQEYRWTSIAKFAVDANGEIGNNFWVLQIGNGMLASLDIKRFNGPYWPQVCQAVWLCDYKMEELQYKYVVNIQETETAWYLIDFLGRNNTGREDTLPPKTWDYGTDEYQEILGTTLGRGVARLILSSFRRGTYRIKHIVSWVDYGFPQLRFDIEPVDVGGL